MGDSVEAAYKGPKTVHNWLTRDPLVELERR